MSKGISIHIGMEYIDPEYYNGDDGRLRTCAQDMLDMQDIAVSQNFESTELLQNEEATREAVKEAISAASESLVAGDMLFISYSGHGTYIEDENGDEEDEGEARDEAWCLYNGMLLDDELHALWKLFDEDVRIFLVSDSCHSGTIAKVAPGQNIDEMVVAKFLPHRKAQELYVEHKAFYDAVRKEAATSNDKELKATVKLIAGCQDVESSYILPNDDNSLLTVELKEVWSAGQFVGTTEEFFEQVKERVVTKAQASRVFQTPNLFTIGKENVAFDTQKPFSIYG
ncbi:MAG: caspase family protein [Epsilonproteobacteria bacterium]|nr:caspase family protein [Campylobacterota bacterium]